MTEETRTVDVGKGFYSLQHYVQEYWVDHVLAYASINGGRSTQDPLFNDHLERLLAMSEQYRTHYRIGNTESPSHDFISAQSSEPRLASLQHHGPVHKLLSMVVQHRTVSKLHFKTNDSGKLFDYIISNFLLQSVPLDMFQEDNEDPTPFSTVHFDYNKRVHALLTTDAFPGLTTLQLTTFKDVYGPYAFVCRYPGCSKTSLGLSSDELRVRHEKSHAPPLLCTYPGCTYTLRFQSLHGLKRHVRENHSNLVRTVPKSIRHRSKAIAVQSSTPSEALPSTIATMTEVVDSSVPPRSPIIPHIVVTMATLPTLETGRSLTCLWCFHVFGSLNAVKDHLVESHKYCETLKANTLCAFCNQELSTTTEYCNHLEIYHTKHPAAIDFHAHLGCLRRIFGPRGSSLANFEYEVMKRYQLTKVIKAGSYDSTPEDKHHQFLFHRASIQCLKRVFPNIGSIGASTAIRLKELEDYYIYSASLAANMEQSHEEPGLIYANTSNSVSFQSKCLWCPRKFPSLSEAQNHQTETHDFDEYLDPTTLCDYCLRMYDLESPLSTLGEYVSHLEHNHSGSRVEETEATAYRAYLSCVLKFSSAKNFSNVDHHFAKIEHQTRIRSLRIQLANSEEDDIPKIRRDIEFNEVYIKTLDRLRPRLFRAIDASASVASRDARPLVHDDGPFNAVLEQSTNDNIAKTSTRWATELDFEKFIMEQTNTMG